MSRTAQLEMQLSAIASAVDRSNRPTSLLTIPALLVVVSVLYAGWSARGMFRQRTLVTQAQAQTEQVRSTVEQIKAETNKGVDLGKLYPPAPFFGSQVGDETWKSSAAGFREPPIISNVTPTTAIANPLVVRNDVTCTVNNEELSSIFSAIDATLNHEFLKGRAWVSQVLMTPSNTGWRSTIRFSLYEKK